jgi:hypothetical protein
MAEQNSPDTAIDVIQRGHDNRSQALACFKWLCSDIDDAAADHDVGQIGSAVKNHYSDVGDAVGYQHTCDGVVLTEGKISDTGDRPAIGGAGDDYNRVGAVVTGNGYPSIVGGEGKLGPRRSRQGDL